MWILTYVFCEGCDGSSAAERWPETLCYQGDSHSWKLGIGRCRRAGFVTLPILSRLVNYWRSVPDRRSIFVLMLPNTRCQCLQWGLFTGHLYYSHHGKFVSFCCYGRRNDHFTTISDTDTKMVPSFSTYTSLHMPTHACSADHLKNK